MKKLALFTVISLISLSIFMAGGCKKETEDPVPGFTMSYDSVNLQGGGKGLQFYATCTNNGVSMGKISIKTPQDSLYLYDQKGASFDKNAAIGMQESNTAYTKIKGTWKFNLAGSSKGGTAYSIDVTATVSK
jgi:hypothetical protein